MHNRESKVWNSGAEFEVHRRARRGGFVCYLFFKPKRSRAGFTMVEIVVILAIIVLVASLLLASFPNLSQRINLQRSSQQLALSFRKVQNMALGVRQVQTPGGKVVPPIFGLYFNRATPNSYIIFADTFPSGVPNGRYDVGKDVVLETVSLDPGIGFASFTSDLGGTNKLQDVLNVAFSVPEARVTIKNASTDVGESAQISLAGRNGTITENVVVRTSGQVYFK